jgi:hypothetical protein
MLRSSGWDKEIAAIARLADRRLLPAIRKIIPRTPVIGRRINIHWLSDGRPANSVAFSGHALGINGVISHLQGATGGIGIPCSNSTTCTTSNGRATERGQGPPFPIRCKRRQGQNFKACPVLSRSGGGRFSGSRQWLEGAGHADQRGVSRRRRLYQRRSQDECGTFRPHERGPRQVVRYFR